MNCSTESVQFSAGIKIHEIVIKSCMKYYSKTGESGLSKLETIIYSGTTMPNIHHKQRENSGAMFRSPWLTFRLMNCQNICLNC